MTGAAVGSSAAAAGGRARVAAALRGRDHRFREPRLRSDRGALRSRAERFRRRRGRSAARSCRSSTRRRSRRDERSADARGSAHARGPARRRASRGVSRSAAAARGAQARQRVPQATRRSRPTSRCCMRAGCCPGLPEADSVPFDLKTLGVVNPRGTVRVHLSRFLHITLDLTYQAADAATASVRLERRSRRDRPRTAVSIDGDAQRAQHRAALLRSSRLWRARAHHAGARARRLGPPAGGLSGLTASGKSGADRRGFAARFGERARNQRLGIVVRARRAADDGHARLDIPARLGARIVELELLDAVCDSLDQTVERRRRAAR